MKVYGKTELFNINIDKISEEMWNQVQKNWDGVAKPIGGLGKFETIYCQIGSILNCDDFDITKRAIIAMCADNGIVSEGVSQSGQDVTSVVTEFMGKNQSSVGKMCAIAKSDVIPVDIGINNDTDFDGVRNCKIRMGTRNFLHEPAMTEGEVLGAISVGIDLVRECKEKGYKILGTGEMGIGNTTTSSALAAALLDNDPEVITGRGAGLTNQGLARKIEVIKLGLEKHGLCKNMFEIEKNTGCTIGINVERDSSAEFAFKALCCVGGLDIAGLCGVFIGGAIYHIPIVVDGLISAVSALVANRILPGVKHYIIGSHSGKEPAIKRINVELNIEPVIQGELALGEGTGVAMFFALLDVAGALYESETTFDKMQIDQYERYE